MVFSILRVVQPSPQFQNIFITPERNPLPISRHCPFPPTPAISQSQESPNLLSVYCICLFWIFRINGLIQYVSFCVWLLSVSIFFSRFIHGIACISPSFLFMAAYYSSLSVCVFIYIYITFCLSIQESMDIWVVSTFWLLF